MRALSVVIFVLMALIYSSKGKAAQSIEDNYKNDPRYQQDRRQLLEYKHRMAANDSDAMYKIGRHYMTGRGIVQNDLKAFRFYRMSGRRGHHRGQYFTAKFYCDGNGIKKDFVKAYAWATLSLENSRGLSSQERRHVHRLLGRIKRNLSIGEMEKAGLLMNRLKRRFQVGGYSKLLKSENPHWAYE